MMNKLSILLVASLLVRAFAGKPGKFSIPITKTESARVGTNPSFPNQYKWIQRALKGNSRSTLQAPIGKEGSQLQGDPIQTQNLVFYTANLSIGTPPQTFRTIVDLNWSDLFLPSSNCGSPSPSHCNPSNATYNSSASSTYHDNGTITTVAYFNVYGYARLSEDVLTFSGGLQVPGQVFHEIKYFEEDPYGSYGTEFFDGVLGLTVEKPWPPWPNNILPSPFRSMIDHNLLDTNLFSVVWPTETREQGSLIFGGYDEDLLDGDLVSHPLYPEDTTSWQIEIEGVTMTNSTGDKEVLVDKPLPHATALFMSFPPILAFSSPLVESLIKHFENWPSACTHFRRVDCTDIPSLPEITIRLKGQNVTLCGEDYVRRLEMPSDCGDFGEDNCYLMFDYMGDMDDTVILGMPFLEKVMGVWNWDDKTVSFGNLKY